MKRPTYRPARHGERARPQRGLTLVELMVAMVLGLLILGGVVSIFLSNRQAFRTSEQLARIQENARTAFELMSRSIREAGAVPCGSNMPVANVLNNASTQWWSNWGDGIRGYHGKTAMPAASFGTSAGDRIEGASDAETPDAVIVLFGIGEPAVTVTSHNPTSAQFKVNTVDHGLTDDEIVMVCDYHHAAVFQVTNASSTNDTIVHNTGTASPGNCSKGLGYPTQCANPGNTYTFQNGGSIVRLRAEAWYIGANDRGGRSLYRARMDKGSVMREEIAEGVRDMKIVYLVNAGGTLATDYVTADKVTDWTQVVAARFTLTLESGEKVGTDGSTLRRQLVHVVSLRNRLQ